MFDILEADIVIFQETKIQRKDLRDDMVLIQGWDSFWSLPKHKKGLPYKREIWTLGFNGPRVLWRCYIHQAICLRTYSG